MNGDQADARAPGGSVTPMKGERGFTLVESIMALFLVVILFVGVATTLQLAIRQKRDIRLQQQANALTQEYVEFARSLTWAQLGLSGDPPVGMPNVGGTGGGGSVASVLAPPFSLPGDELLVVDTTNGLVTPSNPGGETVNGQSFDVYLYVSTIGTGLRRFIVLIEWDSANLSHSRFTSTQISELGAG